MTFSLFEQISFALKAAIDLVACLPSYRDHLVGSIWCINQDQRLFYISALEERTKLWLTLGVALNSCVVGEHTSDLRVICEQPDKEGTKGLFEDRVVLEGVGVFEVFDITAR